MGLEFRRVLFRSVSSLKDTLLEEIKRTIGSLSMFTTNDVDGDTEDEMAKLDSSYISRKESLQEGVNKFA